MTVYLLKTYLSYYELSYQKRYDLPQSLRCIYYNNKYSDFEKSKTLSE